MAKFYPPVPPANTPNSEIKTWAALATLPHSWHVFHSVRWQSIRSGRQGDGEADFVLLHQLHGAIILEVKGGDISVVGGRWTTANAKGTFEIKNPFDQAMTSKHALLHHLRNLPHPVTNVFVSHAVVFPDVVVDESIGLFGPREIILDVRDIQRCENAVMRVVDHWNGQSSMSNLDLDRLTRVLAPTIAVRRTLRSDVDDAQQQLIILTQQQVAVLNNLRLVRKAVILGGAGTGKTILAREKAIQLARDGSTVLFTCFNAALGKYLKRELQGQPNVRAGSFHSICVEEARAAKLAIPPDPNSDWWETVAPDLLLDAAAKNGTCFDAIIIDEGQDFSPHWQQSLLLLVRDPERCAFYLFADGHQDLFCRGWSTPAELPQFVLDLNCRNTEQIARRVGSIYQDPIETKGAQGPEPTFVSVNLPKQGLEVIQRTVSRLLREEKLTPDQIVVLSDDVSLMHRMRETGVDDYMFCELGRIGIVAETVAKFKGLEADCVILALSDRVRADMPAMRPLLYVALSRAKILLFLLASEEARKALKW